MIYSPQLDGRKAEDVARDVRSLFPKYLPGWTAEGEEEQFADALINVFARFSELIIERLNKVPEKNFLAFLDLLGISTVPPQAARVPLTFYLSAQSTSSAVVKAGAQVAAQPGQGEQAPVIFETEHELVVVPATLDQIFLKEPALDQYSNFNSVLKQLIRPQSSSATGAAADATTGSCLTQLVPHALYIGLKMYPCWPEVNRLHIKFVLEGAPAPLDPRTVRWEVMSGAAIPKPSGGPTAAVASIAGDPVEPLRDDTENLAKSGDVVFLNVPPLPVLNISGAVSHWLCCRLQTPINSGSDSTAGFVRESHLPRIKSLSVQAHLERKDLAVDQAFANSIKLDLTKDFLPFGEKPKFGETLYLAQTEAFSNPDALVQLHIELTNPASGGSNLPIPPTHANNTKLRWEFWDGSAWAELGIAELGRRVRILSDQVKILDSTDFSDTTQTLSESGNVSFRFNKPPQKTIVNGQENFWIRARLIAGDYGKEAYYQHEVLRGYTVVPASFAPPSIRSITVAYSVQKEMLPDVLQTYNDFQFAAADPGQPFAPFVPAKRDDPSVYLGLTPASSTLPVARARTAVGQDIFSNQPMSIYVRTTDDGPVPASSLPVSWEYWNGSKWDRCMVRDGTAGFCHSGLVSFLPLRGFAPRKEFELDRYWVRMRRSGLKLQLQDVLLNTTTAIHSVTIQNEILGAGTGKPSQRFKTIHVPILAGQQLEVREPNWPSASEQERIVQEEGADAIREIAGEDKKNEVWVRWHAVPDFYGSGPRDRHYVLDPLTGEVVFGDGSEGLAPPSLPANIRMASYRSGGGSSGNKAALTVTQLKSSVPYIDKVTNWEAAAGGSDAEPIGELLKRGPLSLRHQNRAVTVEDFEDLAMLASKDVARAKCVPLHDLSSTDVQQVQPGLVSLIIVPRSSDAKPAPSKALLSQVRTYLDDRRTSPANLVLVAPKYVSVDVETEVVLELPEAAHEVETAVTNSLRSYLHPVTGGHAQTGWMFGRIPHQSELYARIEAVPGISHVRNLQVTINGNKEEIARGLFLICCGNAQVVTTLEE